MRESATKLVVEILQQIPQQMEAAECIKKVRLSILVFICSILILGNYIRSLIAYTEDSGTASGGLILVAVPPISTVTSSS